MKILYMLLQAHFSGKHVMTNVTFMLWMFILFVFYQESLCAEKGFTDFTLFCWM